jgi:hypothetical protein
MKEKLSKLLGKLFGSGIDFTEDASLPEIPMEGDLRHAAKLAQAAKDKAEREQRAAEEAAIDKQA